MPSFSSAQIARTTLIERLDAIVDSDEHRVLLICSPAGSGKTVLLADWASRLWARTSRRPALGWISVSEHPAPGLSLWQTLRDQLGLPNPPQRRTVDAPDFDAAHLVEALTARGTPTVIVIDDAHLVAEPLALAGLEHFLLHAPPTVTTVVSGRFDPPLHWHLLGLTERSTRWGAADLAMTSTEVAALCREHHCELDDAELATVLDLTHGWAALVRITAMCLVANPDRAAALGVLARPPRAVSDFLVGELIGALPTSVRLFVTYTSVPASFTEKMADELIGGGATHTLYELDRMNFPVSSIARGGEVWFSYHPMLRAYFLAEVNRLGAQARAELHLRTANALRRAGLPRQALTHLLAVGDPRHLRNLLVEHGTTMVLDGDGAALFGELQRARPSMLDDPFVWLLRVLDALFHGSAADAQAYLDVAGSRGSRPSFVPAHWIDALTVAATVDAAAATGMVAGDLAVAAVPPTGNPDIDCYLAIQSATALMVGEQLGRAEEVLSRGLALALHAGHPRLALRALTRLTFIACGREATAAMRDRAGRALALAAEHGLLGTPDAAQAMTAAGLAAYLRGEEPDPSHIAAALSQHAVQDGSESPLAGWHGYVVGLLLAVEQGADRRTAVDDLRRATQLLLDKDTVPAATATVVPHVVWALLSVSEPLAAQLLAERGQRLLGDLPDVTVARAAVAEAAGHSQAVLALVEPLLDGANDARPSTLVTGWLLYSSAQHASGNRAKARTGLENALRHAAADHLVRPFLDVPNAIELLDVYAGRWGRLDEFGDLVRRNRNTARRSTHPALTDAELTVLKHLPSGRTAQQIAGDLGVSINTVKTHLRSIYAKFGANSRVAALDFARRSGVL